MKIYQLIILSVLISGQCYTIWAQTSSPQTAITQGNKADTAGPAAPLPISSGLTLDKAVSSAFEKNADLQKKKITLDAAKRTYESSWNVWLPSISLSGSAGLSTGTSKDWEFSYPLNASAILSLSFSASIPAKLAQTALLYDSEKIAYDQLRAETEAAVFTSYHELAAERANIDILKENQHLALLRYEQVQKNYRSGLASELEMLKARYTYQSLFPSIQKAESTYENNLASFRILTGLSADDGFPVIDGGAKDYSAVLPQISIPAGTNLASEYAEKRYDVLSKKHALEKAKLTEKIQNASAKIPSLGIKASASPSYGGQTEGVSVLGSLSLSVPVDAFIPGSADNLSLKTYSDAVESARITLDSAVQNAVSDIQKKAAELSRLSQTLDTAVLNYSIAQRAYELSEQGYKAGLISQTDAAETRQQMFSARQSVLQAQTDFITGCSALASSLRMTYNDFCAKFALNATHSAPLTPSK